LPPSGALSVAQASLIALPDELLGRILRRAWADRPPRPAAEEVRAAAGLASVCRRWRELLRAPPLPLALDFSVARLSLAQRTWLLDPAQAGRVEAANFFVDGAEESEDALWEQPVLDNFLALHGGTVLQLSGVPLQLVATLRQEEPPASDLSGLTKLTKLGISCGDIDLRPLAPSLPAYMWLWPERLPGALGELELLGLEDFWPGSLAWAPHTSAGSARWLPRLRTLRVTRVGGKESLPICEPALLDGLPVLPAFEVTCSGANVEVDINLFGRVGSVRVVTSGYVLLWGERESIAMLADRLCPAGLRAAELCAEIYIYLLPEEGPDLHEVVREIISRYGDRFAVEVEVPGWPGHDEHGEGEGLWGDIAVHRLAWRHWPAPGAPDLPAARAAHEHARAWAVAGAWRRL